MAPAADCHETPRKPFIGSLAGEKVLSHAGKKLKQGPCMESDGGFTTFTM